MLENLILTLQQIYWKNIKYGTYTNRTIAKFSFSKL